MEMSRRETDPVKSFFFIEDCFYYTFTDKCLKLESKFLNEIDLLISTHNDGISKEG